MSGILGIINLDRQPVDQLDLDRMLQVLAHRGPDGKRIWADGSVGLGQLMLCTTPESVTEQLPWKDPQSGLCITADARIDNRSELSVALSLETSIAKQSPDSQLILKAFGKWGENCVDHLLGDFAFAIWDSSNRYLFCARDPFTIISPPIRLSSLPRLRPLPRCLECLVKLTIEGWRIF